MADRDSAATVPQVHCRRAGFRVERVRAVGGEHLAPLVIVHAPSAANVYRVSAAGSTRFPATSRAAREDVGGPPVGSRTSFATGRRGWYHPTRVGGPPVVRRPEQFPSGARPMSPVRLAAVLACLVPGAGPAAAADVPAVVLEVDARDLSRKLVHATLEVPCRPGPLRLWYPKWLPGAHGPYGRVEDVAGFRVETPDGTPVPWARDEVDLHCFVAEGAGRGDRRPGHAGHGLRVRRPGRRRDLHGRHPRRRRHQLGHLPGVPRGPAADDQPVKLRLRLPAGWKHATALQAEAEGRGRRRDLRPGDLATLADSPLIAGRHLKTIKLDAGVKPPGLPAPGVRVARGGATWTPRWPPCTGGWCGRRGPCSDVCPLSGVPLPGGVQRCPRAVRAGAPRVSQRGRGAGAGRRAAPQGWVGGDPVAARVRPLVVRQVSPAGGHGHPGFPRPAEDHTPVGVRGADRVPGRGPVRPGRGC